MGHWNHRVVRRVYASPAYKEVSYQIHEAYYGLDDGDKPSITTDPTWPSGETIEELREELQMMLLAIDNPVLDYETREEIKPPTERTAPKS